MKLIFFMSSIIAAPLITHPVSSDNLAGSFDWPFFPFHAYRMDLGHLERNTDLNDSPYHAGEDWNRGASYDDEGDALYAVADGTVVYVQNDPDAVPGKGRMIIVRYELDNGKVVDMAYSHCEEILVDKYDAYGNLSKVEKGEMIATLGGTGGVVPHLHWEAQIDLSLHPATNPYYGGNKANGKPREPLTIENALRYTSPSLLVDDRTDEELIPLEANRWTYFTVPDVAPGSTAFVTDNQTGDRFSIQQAVDQGLVTEHGVIYQKDTKWYFRSDVTSIWFKPNVQYAVRANDDFFSFSVLVPGLSFSWERAKKDMLRGTSTDSRFKSVHPDIFGEDLGWQTGWELRYLAFGYRGNQGTELIWVYHATNKINPLFRAWTYFSPDSGQQAAWSYFYPNTL